MPDVDEGSAVAQKDYRGGLPVATILGGYELISILGKGGFDFAHNQDVAIKEYLPTALAIREGRTTVLPISTNHAEQFAWGRERFLDEARTLERLDHAPAVVRVLDLLEANGTAYMVMALVEGETLNKRLLRVQRLAPDVIERLVIHQSH
jgi:serine/threonine protein kinase